MDLTDAEQAVWNGRSISIALNTLPASAGSTTLPDVDVALESGANFLIQLDGLSEGRLLVAENYIPWEAVQVPGRPDASRIESRTDLSLALDSADFVEMVVEANETRWARDGQEFPVETYTRGVLTHGTADRDSPDFDSHAVWFVDRQRGMIELRIPWAWLLVMAPSQKEAFGGTDPDGLPQQTEMEGVSVAVFVVEPEPASGETRLVGSFPRVDASQTLTQEPTVYSWERWFELRYRPYFKESYYALQALWGSWPRFTN